MGRPRKSRSGLPSYCYRDRRNGAYFMLVPGPDRKLIRRTYGDDLHRMLDDWGKTWGASQRQGDTVAAALDAYIGDLAQRRHRGELDRSTEIDYQKHIMMMRKVFGAVRIIDVDGPMLEKWRDVRGMVSPTQFNHERTVLLEAFKVAIRRGMTKANPVLDLPPMKLQRRTTYVETQWVNKVLEHCPRPIQAAVVLTCSIGLRQGDILRLKRSQFGDSGLVIVPNKTRKKSKKVMHYPWSPGLRLACELASRKVTGIDGYWLTTREGKPYSSSGFRAMWNRALMKARAANPDLPDFTFHDLRAKAGTDGTDARMLGIDERTFQLVYNRKPITAQPAR